MPSFVPGQEIAREFYGEVVAPLIEGVPHSAALLGTGSDVLGFDTERSTDHGWGPRLQVFVLPLEVERLRRIVEEGLPTDFRGWPTRFGWDDVPVGSHVEVVTLDDWLLRRLGFVPKAEVDILDWLTTPQQVLLEVTAGAVFHDDSGDLTRAREVLALYPDDVWLWLLACQWRRIDQEEPFVGRAAEVGDDIGSRIVAARLVREMMRLCFLLERRYPPYSKWLGSAFRQLRAYDALGAPLLGVLRAADFPARESALVESIRKLAHLHNAAGVTGAMDETVGFFHDRPFRVLGSGRFVDACLERVVDPRLQSLPLVGAVDQNVDSTDVTSYPATFRRLRSFYELADGAASETR